MSVRPGALGEAQLDLPVECHQCNKGKIREILVRKKEKPLKPFELPQIVRTVQKRALVGKY